MAVRAEPAKDQPDRLGPFADADQFHAPLALPDGDRGWLRSALRRMVLIRSAEELIGDMVSKGKIRCPCHLAVGQEAPAVGLAVHLRPTDRVFGAHRSHAHYLALGGTVHGLLAEVQGRDTGASRGMGGSMHLIDVAHGLYGTVPIVAATIPIAVGAGLAAKMDGAGDVAVSLFGDGATEEGVFHEAMNLAAVMRLPVLFLCENNLFSSHLHIDLRQPRDSVARYAEAHAVPWTRVDGNDVVQVAEVAGKAIAAMRAGGGPHFIEAVTYRWRGHVGPREDEDVGVERKDDLARWKLRDPIRRLAEALVVAGDLDQRALADDWRSCRAEVQAEWERASRDAYPPAEALLDYVYTAPPAPGRRQ
ncbi:MAG: thiamine pyrophosphate-dependent dehydrogenase E1 component subunit alpha [Gemmatimonadales bacterium]